MTAMIGAERSVKGSVLYAEHTGRFTRMIDDDPDKALDEYGFTFVYSIDESDAASFMRKLDMAEDSWRQSFLETVALHRRGKLDDAEKRYKDLLSKAPTRKEIEYNLAALFLQRGDTAEAVKRLENFETYIDSLKEANLFVEDCRTRIAEMRAELNSL